MEDKKPVRTPVREGEVKLRPGEYAGRNGEILRRAVVRNGNPFDFPDEIKEKNWSYQWVRHSVYNNTDHSELSTMKRSGWREVHPDGLNGFFKEETPEGQNFIAKEGLVLVERPEQMTIDAQEENLRAANQQYDRQLHARFDSDAPLPSGYVAHAREIQQERYQPAPREFKPEHRHRQSVPVDE